VFCASRICRRRVRFFDGKRHGHLTVLFFQPTASRIVGSVPKR
jgi:hypothetical protein